MTLTPEQKQFLSRERQGRTSYSLLDYEKVQASIGELISRGLVKNRRMGIREGVQLTEAGKMYLAGEA